MPLSPEPAAIYRFLIQNVHPIRRVTTYGATAEATGVEIGVEGGNIGRVLGEIARRCDELGLPPLTSIVVHADTKYDSDRHGMPGAGYFVEQAASIGPDGLPAHPEFARWAAQPQPDDTHRWQLRGVIEQSQDSVWAHREWPDARRL